MKDYNLVIEELLTDLDPRWGARNYRAHRTSDGVAFTCNLTDGGKVVASVDDAGRGGAPRIWWADQCPTWNSKTPAAIAWRAETAKYFAEGDDELLLEAVLLRAGL